MQKRALREIDILRGYALPLDVPNLQLGATAGVRYNHVKAELEIDPVLLPRQMTMVAAMNAVRVTVDSSRENAY